jgi:hypothetical protein
MIAIIAVTSIIAMAILIVGKRFTAVSQQGSPAGPSVSGRSSSI